jgi:hypothetical protein
MANQQAIYSDDSHMNVLAWLAAGLATGVIFAIVALDEEAASRRCDARAAAARVAPAFVAVSSALH